MKRLAFIIALTLLGSIAVDPAFAKHGNRDRDDCDFRHDGRDFKHWRNWNGNQNRNWNNSWRHDRNWQDRNWRDAWNNRNSGDRNWRGNWNNRNWQNSWRNNAWTVRDWDGNGKKWKHGKHHRKWKNGHPAHGFNHPAHGAYHPRFGVQNLSTRSWLDNWR